MCVLVESQRAEHIALYSMEEERIGLFCRFSLFYEVFLFFSTYSAVRLAGEVLGSDQAGEEEGDDRGLHCEDFFYFVFFSAWFELGPADTQKKRARF